MTNTLKVKPLGEREVVKTRVFEAPHKLVFDARTTSYDRLEQMLPSLRAPAMEKGASPS